MLNRIEENKKKEPDYSKALKLRDGEDFKDYQIRMLSDKLNLMICLLVASLFLAAYLYVTRY